MGFIMLSATECQIIIVILAIICVVFGIWFWRRQFNKVSNAMSQNNNSNYQPYSKPADV